MKERTNFMKRVFFALLLWLGLAAPTIHADVVYEQPPSPSGGLLQSSFWDPDGSDWDQFVWDSFTIGASQAITEVRWRGGYSYNGAQGGHVIGFNVSIYPSTPGINEPDVTHPPLVSYTIAGNAGETPAGTIGGISMYDYQYTLPAAFQATSGVQYWLQIVGLHHGLPEWGFARATGGNGSHFRRLSDYMYQFAPGDACFTLLTSGAATFMINASASPANAGSVQGAGAYPAGTNASLVASPNAGFGFVNWTENGTQVSTSRTYTFTVTADRTLVANFTTAYTITASASPVYAGSVTGAGTFNAGAPVMLTATPNAGFSFFNWTEFGAPVSSSPVYTFPASADRTLVANFVTSEPSVLFDFDNAPVHTSLPIDLTVGGVTAHLSATGSGFSIQPADTLGFTPAGFGGYCLYPNSVFAADLHVSFSRTMTGFSILYSPQELGCDDSATMRVTAYMDGAFVGTNTATVPVPGTWPTGTLSINTSQPFNSVVVHYDSRPPTCQDWGPIFLADNMIVTPSACTGAAVTQQPAPVSICYAGTGTLGVAGDGTGPLAYQWEREVTPGTFVAVSNGLTPGGSVVSGSDAATLVIENASAADAGVYRCVVSNDCGSATSDGAVLSVCTADFNCSGAVNSQDFFDFLNGFFAGATSTDINRDGVTNSQDFFDYLNAFFAGC
jgi:hypothetical protein